MKRFKSLIASLLLSLFVFTGVGVDALTTSYSKSDSNNNNVAYAQSHKKKPVKKAKAKKSVTVYITNTGHKYHSSGCRYLRQSCISISKQNAINQGYEPCKVCRP